MSKARRMKKMGKKAQKRARFFDSLQTGLLETLAWAKGELPLRVTTISETTRTVEMQYRWGRPSRTPDEVIPTEVSEADNQIAEAEWLLWDEDTENTASSHVYLSLRYADAEMTRSAETYWAALCLIRQELEPKGILVRCYGGSQGVYFSGMSLSMGTGAIAYRLTMGHPAGTADQINIFHSGPDLIPATVKAQEAFYHEWLASLTKRNN